MLFFSQFLNALKIVRFPIPYSKYPAVIIYIRCLEKHCVFPCIWMYMDVYGLIQLECWSCPSKVPGGNNLT